MDKVFKSYFIIGVLCTLAMIMLLLLGLMFIPFLAIHMRYHCVLRSVYKAAVGMTIYGALVGISCGRSSLTHKHTMFISACGSIVSIAVLSIRVLLNLFVGITGSIFAFAGGLCLGILGAVIPTLLSIVTFSIVKVLHALTRRP